MRLRLDDETVDAIAMWVVGVIAFLHVVYYFPRVVDDAFISLRFAENLAHGDGAVYNLGARVEGYSGPSWMLLQSVGLLFGADGVTWTKVLGVGSFFALLVGVHRMARQMFGVSRYLALIATLYLALDSYVVDWAVLGLETPLHLALIVWCPCSIHAFLHQPRRRTRLVATAALVGLATTRPESLLYVGLCLLAPVITGRSIRDRIQIARRLLRIVLPAFGLLLAFLAIRYAYYGQLLPQTYRAKGAAITFDEARLKPLIGQGSSLAESIVNLGGMVLLLGFGLRRRALAPALMALACVYFTASVSLDWMPNLRHLLPCLVLAPLGWIAFAHAMIGRGRVRDAIGWASLVVLGTAAQFTVRVDSRVSLYESGAHGWLRPKTKALWKGSLGAFRHQASVAVSEMGDYDMGQITQAWPVLETSRDPVEESWYFARDIGAIGYFTGVRVFDTEALFTRAVSDSKAWRDSRTVDDALIRRAMALRPLATELYDSWTVALGRNEPLLQGYRIRYGTVDAPAALIAFRTAPAREEILRRYDAFASKFPRLYYLHTLYGEAVGEAVVKRVRVVHALPPSSFDGPGP